MKVQPPRGFQCPECGTPTDVLETVAASVTLRPCFHSWTLSELLETIDSKVRGDA